MAAADLRGGQADRHPGPRDRDGQHRGDPAPAGQGQDRWRDCRRRCRRTSPAADSATEAETSSEAEINSEAGIDTETDSDRWAWARNRPWGKVALAAAGVALAVLAGLTVVESITGKPLSSYTKGGDQTGSTVSNLGRDSKPTPSPSADHAQQDEQPHPDAVPEPEPGHADAAAHRDAHRVAHGHPHAHAVAERRDHRDALIPA